MSTDFLTASVAQLRDHARRRLSRGRLLRAYRVDCEYAAMCRRNGLFRKAQQLLATGRDRTYQELEKSVAARRASIERRTGIAFGDSRRAPDQVVKSHNSLIDGALDHARRRVGYV